ncbi:MAG: Sodium:proton antiporter [uncultured Sulfurovum sp.]|uniref:Sodium:proton antiporter n=1 Tax=uncultured Sulfurovum sp. TaxID=269237 RepID=A0A6S6SGF8_9BACT|nr:MAG: Sodium:proton antiporter [uncultured Sulfurovum sp.]
MEVIISIFDGLLCVVLLWVAWQSLSSTNLFKAIVLFITFGLLLAISWVRLNAIDVAIAEVAIGAGLTGALLLAALAKLHNTTDTDKNSPMSDNIQYEQGTNN